MSETNLEQFREVAPSGRLTLQNSSLLKVRLDNDSIQAKLGSIVAYQGDVRFEHQGGGLGRFFKKALTGEGVKLISANGVGDLFLAQDARKIMVIDLNSERMTLNGDSILVFEGNVELGHPARRGRGTYGRRPLQRRPRRYRQGGRHVTREPVLLDTNPPTFADPDSPIAWSGGVRTSVHSAISFKTYYRAREQGDLPGRLRRSRLGPHTK